MKIRRDYVERLRLLQEEQRHFREQERANRASDLRVILVAVGVLVVLLAVAALYVLPTTVSMHCTAQDWEELPAGYTWMHDVRMAPQFADCTVTISGPTYAIGRILAGFK